MKPIEEIHTAKVPPSHAFRDVSDYARPAADLIVRLLLPTPLSPIHLTLFFTVLGIAAAAFIAAHRSLTMAAILLLMKNVLDAADGALARARKRPSRVGRFLDSICDFFITLLVCWAIAWREGLKNGDLSLGILALGAVLSSLLQGSVFNYYSIRYRQQVKGDTTSRLLEEEAAGYSWDNPRILRVLFRLYQVIYGWQDRLMIRIDRALGFDKTPLRPSFLTAASFLGLGIQILLISVCLFAGRPLWALWVIVTVFNAYAACLLMAGRRMCGGKKLDQS